MNDSHSGEALLDTEIEGEGMTAYQAHREGIRKLREWEDNDFDLARHENSMRLFDDEMEDTDDGGPEEKG